MMHRLSTINYRLSAKKIFSLIVDRLIRRSLSHPKNEGSLVVMTMIIGLVMLGLSLTAVNLLITDIRVTEDFVGSEKAYFAAEAGMERALLALADEPVDWVDNEVKTISDSQSVTINIPNQVVDGASFSFDLDRFQSKKFRMKYDERSALGVNPGDINPVRDFTIKIDGASVPEDEIHWKIICEKQVGGVGRTIAIQRVQDIPGSDFASLNGATLSALVGNYDVWKDDGTFVTGSGGAVSNFLTDNFDDPAAADLLTDDEIASCFFSVTNNATSPLTVTVSPPTGAGDIMTPEKVRITSRGESGGREKIIEFTYFQKNLGELFDFVFFHTGN